MFIKEVWVVTFLPGNHDVFTDDERRAFRVCFGGQWQPADSIPNKES